MPALTSHIQMLQIGALGQRFDQRLVGHTDTRLQLQMRQLRTATRKQLQPFVGDATAIGKHNPLDFRAGAIAALTAQLPEYHLQRLVSI